MVHHQPPPPPIFLFKKDHHYYLATPGRKFTQVVRLKPYHENEGTRYSRSFIYDSNTEIIPMRLTPIAYTTAQMQAHQREHMIQATNNLLHDFRSARGNLSR